MSASSWSKIVVCFTCFVSCAFALEKSPLSLEFGDPATLRMEAVPFVGYQLQTADSLVSPLWVDIDNEKDASGLSLLEWSVPKPQAPVYFRVLQRDKPGVTALSIGSSSDTAYGMGLITSNGFGFLAATTPTVEQLFLMRVPGGETAIFSYGYGWNSPILIFGNYYIQYSIVNSEKTFGTVQISDSTGRMYLNQTVAIGSPAGALSAFSESPRIASATDFPDVEAEGRAYVLESLQTLMQWSWNVVPYLDGLNLQDLKNYIEEIRASLDSLETNWPDSLTNWYQSDGFVEQVDGENLPNFLGYTGALQSSGLADELLNEQHNRITGADIYPRNGSDGIQDIKDSAGNLYDESKYFVRGQVIDYLANFGKPVQGVSLYLFAGPDQTTTSNSVGEFGFLLGPGDYTLEARSPGIGYTYSTQQPFSVPAIAKSSVGYTTHPIHIIAYQSQYLKASLGVVSVQAQRKFAAPGESLWLDYEIVNNGNGPNTSCNFGEFLLTDNYSSMTQGFGSNSYPGNIAIPVLQPGESAVVRVPWTVPAEYSPGDRIYTGGALWNNCQEPVTFYRPEVQFVICDGNFATLPASLIGHVLSFNWEESTDEVVEPGTSTSFRFFFDGTVNAYDSETSNPQLSPESYSYVRNGDSATVTFNFNNTTGAQTVTGTSVYNIILEGKCGGSFTGSVQFTVNNGGTINSVSGTGSGFFMIE